jgi:hypothetical protein
MLLFLSSGARNRYREDIVRSIGHAFPPDTAGFPWRGYLSGVHSCPCPAH